MVPAPKPHVPEPQAHPAPEPHAPAPLKASRRAVATPVRGQASQGPLVIDVENESSPSPVTFQLTGNKQKDVAMLMMGLQFMQNALQQLCSLLGLQD